MPRVSICLNLEDKDKPNFSGENEHYDFCKECLAKDKQGCIETLTEYLIEKHPDIQKDVIEQEVIDGMNGGCEHPPYSDCDYTCEFCENDLTDDDN